MARRCPGNGTFIFDLSSGLANQDLQITTLPSLRPSASFRSTFQYNNMMYETLSLLPAVLLNQSFESYVAEHILMPLNMTKTTYSVAEAEEQKHLGSNNTHTFAHGFLRHMRDFYTNDIGVLRPTVPYFQRPGDERVWAGAGGILTSTKDLVSSVLSFQCLLFVFKPILFPCSLVPATYFTLNPKSHR